MPEADCGATRQRRYLRLQKLGSGRSPQATASAMAQNLGLHGLRGYGGEATLPRSGLLELFSAADGAKKPRRR
jgi:hypothetical protein